jgi:sortase A
VTEGASSGEGSPFLSRSIMRATSVVPAPVTDRRAMTPPKLTSPDVPEPGALARFGVTRTTGTDGPGTETPGSANGEKKKNPRGDTWLQWAGAVLTALGLLLALFAAFLFLFTPLQASRAQHRLVSELQGHAGLAVLTGHVPPEGKAVAIIDISALHIHQVVVEGTSASDLTAGPGLMPGSALPGTPGNTVIAGRRYLYGAPFSGLGSLKSGDKIQVVSGYGSFQYNVVGTREIVPGQPDPVSPTAANQLTLVTSNASLAPTDRQVVIARLVGQPVNVRVSSIGLPPRSERALSGDPKALLPALLWAIALLVVVAITVRLYRRWHRTWPTYIMTTPVLLAFAVLLFQYVARLLPATL